MPNIALIAGNLVSDSGLDSSTINAQNYSRKHSARDFPNGTLIETTIDYSVTNGDPFVLEITGNSYGALVPFNMAYQGYIYNNTTINHGGISTGAAITGMSLFNYNGKLCFWFPSQAYWQGFNVYVYIADTGFRENKVTNITNVAKPAGITKEISMTFQHLIRAASASVGTTNYVAKFTGNVAVGDSQIFDNGTNVGIGTASPSYKFHVVSSDTTVGAFRNSSAANSQLLIGNTAGDLSIRTLSTGDGYIFSDTGKYLDFGTNASFRMRITSAGDVGIGTSSPTNAKLVVAGTSAGTVGAIMSTDTAGTTSFLRMLGDISSQNLINWQTGTALRFAISNQNYTSFSELMRITSAGDVGIGTNTPAAKLDVSGNAYVGTPGTDASIFLRGYNSGLTRLSTNAGSSANYNGFLISVNSSQVNSLPTWNFDFGGFDRFNYVQDAFSVWRTPSGGTKTNLLTVLGGGNVGIGTATPWGRFGVVSATGSVGFNVGASPSPERGNLYYDTDGTGWKFNIGKYQSNIFTAQMTFQDNGNVGIGTTSPAARLDVFTTSTNGIDLRNAPTTLGDQTSKNSPRLRLVSSRYEGGNVDAPFSLQNVRTGSPTNDQRLAITNFGDVEVMSITNSGNVGIGAIPSAWGSNTGGPVLEFRNGGHVFGAANSFMQVGANAYYDGSNYVYKSSSFASRYLQNDGQHSWFTAASGTAGGTITFSERMRIANDGNVGIGAAPLNRLHVEFSSSTAYTPSNTLTAPPIAYFYNSSSADAAVASTIRLDAGNLTGNNATSISAVRTGNADAAMTFGTRSAGGSVTERMRISADGNVGIGTTTPTAGKLQIANLTSATMNNGLILTAADLPGANNGQRIGLTWGVNTTVRASIGMVFENLLNSSNAYMTFGTGSDNTERMRITSGGNVGIGTQSPTLEVNSAVTEFTVAKSGSVPANVAAINLQGDRNLDGTSTSRVGSVSFWQTSNLIARINGLRGGADNSGALDFLTNSAGGGLLSRLYIQPNGRIGINTTTDAGFQLDVNGGTRVTGRLTITGNDTLAQSMSRAGTSAFASEIYNSGGDNSWLIWGVESSLGGVIFPGSTAYAAVIGQFRNTPLEFFTNNTIRGSFSAAGAFRVNNLAGTGSRVVVADANGVLSTTDTAPVTGTGTAGYITRWTGTSTQGVSQIFDNGTRIGIGTVSPAARLDIRGTEVQDLYLISTTGSNQENTIQSYFNNGGGWSNLSTKSQNLLFYTGPSGGPTVERLRITSGGVVAINTVTPDVGTILHTARGSNGTVATFGLQGLTINPRIRIDASETNNTVSFNTNYNGGTSPAITFLTSEVERLRIFANGRIGINTTTDAGYQLDVNGSFRASGVIRSAAAVGVTTGFFQLDHPGAQTWKLGVFSDNTSTFSIGNDLGGTFASRYLNITNAGNVGIGTTNPIARLDVNGSGIFRDITYIGRDSAANDVNAVTLRQTAGTDATLGTLYFQTELRPSATGTNRRVDIYAGDNVGYRNINFPYGSIGIGTTSPTYKLDINGTLRSVNGANFATSSGNVGVNTASPVMPFQLNNYGGFDGNGNQLIIRNNVYYNNTNARSEPIQNGYQTQIEMENLDGKIRFSTSSASNNVGTAASLVERMRITNNGEVWINTTTDAGDYKLQVSGNVLTNFIYTRNNTDALIFGTNSAVNPYVQGLSSNALVLGTSNNPRILITSDGNVGIGTTSPVSKLQVQGAQQNAAQTVIRFAANNASGQIKALDLQINAGSNLAVFNTAYAGSAMGIDFADAGTSRMRIDTVGNVGIGTDSPSHKLTLFRSGIAPSFISFRNGVTTSGDITIGASASGNLDIINPNATSISFYTSSSNWMNITSGGSVLIGSVSDIGSSYKLQVYGNTYQTGYAQINGVSNFPSLYVSSHIITGSSSQAVLSLGATLNTTGAPSIIYADISDTASGAETNFMQFVNGSTKFRVTKQGDIQTAAPAGGTAKKWKLGSVVATTVTMVTSQYVEVEIDGTFYRLALVSPA